MASAIPPLSQKFHHLPVGAPARAGTCCRAGPHAASKQSTRGVRGQQRSASLFVLCPRALCYCLVFATVLFEVPKLQKVRQTYWLCRTLRCAVEQTAGTLPNYKGHSCQSPERTGQTLLRMFDSQSPRQIFSATTFGVTVDTVREVDAKDAGCAASWTRWHVNHTMCSRC